MKRAIQFLADTVSNMRKVAREMELDEDLTESLAWVQGYVVALLKICEEEEEVER